MKKKSKTKRFPRCDRIDCVNIIESTHTFDYVCRALYDNDFKRSDGSAYECPFYKAKEGDSNES